MLTIYIIKARRQEDRGEVVIDQERIIATYTNRPTAEMEVRRLTDCAEDPGRPEFGMEITMDPLPVGAEIFDLWREIRRHPAYAFGTLFTLPDFDRGVPAAFDQPEIEEILAVTGRAYIEKTYDEGEPFFHRLSRRFRPDKRRAEIAARCPVSR